MSNNSVSQFSLMQRHPHILYWLWDEVSLQDKQYKKDLDRIAHSHTFDFVILSQRHQENFYDFQKYVPVFEELVHEANSLGISIALQLWPEVTHTGACRPVPLTQAVALISEAECYVDTNGTGDILLSSKAVRDPQTHYPMKSGLLKAFAFEKTSEGYYKPEP